MAIAGVMACAQQMRMEYLGELGHLAIGQRVGPAVGVREGVARMEGPGWRWRMSVVGGSGWTELFAADFDGNGKRDYLVAERQAYLLGGCGAEVVVTVLLFDSLGRPMPWRVTTYLPSAPGFANDTFPFLPVLVMDRDGDGKAEFETVDCQGRRSVARWPEPLGAMDGRITELTLDWREEQIGIDGRLYGGWPTAVIRDGVELREIDTEDSWARLLDAFRNGSAVKRLGDSGLLWVDGTGSGERRDIRVSLAVGRRTRRTASGGQTVLFGDWTYRKKARGWVRFRGGTEEELLPDGVTVRNAHTAMGHTETGETRYARPSGAGHLLGVAAYGELALTQWGVGFFALHSNDGKLLASRVQVAQKGLLVGWDDGFVFWTGNEVVTVPGRLVWRRE